MRFSLRWAWRAWELLLLAGFVCGCQSIAPPDSPSSAVLDDCTTALDWHVVAVDGQLPTRRRHPVVTVVPLVQLEPGEHTLTVESLDGQETFAVTGNFKAGQSYRLKMEQGRLSVVETDD